MSNIIWNRAKYRRSIRKQGGARSENFAINASIDLSLKTSWEGKKREMPFKIFFLLQKSIKFVLRDIL